MLAASYEAKAYGVRSAMGGGQARALCPHLVVVPPRFDSYVEASKAVFAIFEDTTPLVEGISIDEAFLDVTGLARVSGSPLQIATALRARVREQVGLAITVGVARTKFLAKVASGVAKPDGLLVVPPDGELEFLHPLPVQRLWGVGRVTADKLGERGIRTVRDVAALDEHALVAMLGRASGRHLHALANNRDPRPVQVGPSAPLDRLAARARPQVPHDGRTRHRPRRHRRPGVPAPAQGRAGVPHGRAAAALRRLQPGDPLAHDGRAERRHRGDPGHGAQPAGDRHAR